MKNLNKQNKLFSQGMCPVAATGPVPKKASVPCRPPMGSGHWERLRERPVFGTEDASFTVTFRLRVDNRAATYVAFTYPYTYRELQATLTRMDKKHGCHAMGYEDLLDRNPER